MKLYLKYERILKNFNRFSIEKIYNLLYIYKLLHINQNFELDKFSKDNVRKFD